MICGDSCLNRLGQIIMKCKVMGMCQKAKSARNNASMNDAFDGMSDHINIYIYIYIHEVDKNKVFTRYIWVQAPYVSRYRERERNRESERERERGRERERERERERSACSSYVLAVA